MIGFDRTYTSVGRLRGTHIRFSKANLIGDELTLRIATSFNLDDQASQNVGNRIFLAAAKETAMGLDAGIVSNKNLIVLRDCDRGW